MSRLSLASLNCPVNCIIFSLGIGLLGSGTVRLPRSAATNRPSVPIKEIKSNFFIMDDEHKSYPTILIQGRPKDHHFDLIILFHLTYLGYRTTLTPLGTQASGNASGEFVVRILGLSNFIPVYFTRVTKFFNGS